MKTIQVTGMRQLKKRPYLQGGNVGLDLETMEGHSYNWYSLVKRIKGKVILNTYNYSPTTIKHIWKMRDALKQLNVKYVELEAPRGLQDLSESKTHIIYIYGKEIVKQKNSRSKDLTGVGRVLKQIDILESLGVKITRKALKDSIKYHEELRATNLKFARFNKAKKKLENYLENECAFRDYEIYAYSSWGKHSNVGVYKAVSKDNMESDVQDAINTFLKDGFPTINFYIEGF